MPERSYRSRHHVPIIPWVITLALLFSQPGSALTPDFDHLFQLAQSRYGTTGLATIRSWETFLRQSKDRERPEIIERVNLFINNHVVYRDDQEIWSAQDYWATPLETLGRGLGDCEDFAFAKYVSLQILGVPIEQMLMTYVRAKILDGSGKARAHMVLSYYPDLNQEPLILDSLTDEILPASQRKDLFPIFSFNTQTIRVGGTSQPAADPMARLSHWRDLMARMGQERWQ
ncbi:MAG: transglutaminase-like cysteine peptidase [Proteobacteria bacterium]|nr:transglutaminase-like cysteine peptidase [Pseudomonadota bacterium]MBU1685898.1 transglutaminase-like cysteine peptidase [Pseudomonadota bacterium]